MSWAKQAVVEVRHIYGTRNSVSVALVHKGSVVKAFDGQESQQVVRELTAALRTWAFNHKPRYYINN